MALLVKNHLDTIISIEIEDKKQFKPLATGFLAGFIANNKGVKNKEHLYRIFLLTNRHVFLNLDRVWLRFNKKDNQKEKATRFPLELTEKGEKKWLAHKNNKVDLAMVTISPSFLNQHGVEYSFFIEEQFAYYNDFSNLGIEQGDELYILGFPMGKTGILQNKPIVRHGIIARIDNEIIAEGKHFYIDAFVYPGNSGGPVVLKPTNIKLKNTKAVNTSYILGVVSGYQPYREILYTHQTNPPSFAGISIENSGLATVVPIDFAKEIYIEWIASRKILEKEAPGKKTIEEQI